MTENVRGTLRIAATVSFGRAHLLPLFPQLLKQYPELQVELELTDRIVDLIQEEVDIAICFSEQISDTSVVARRLAINRRVICASPAYLEAHGAPEVPEDLLRHNCLRLSAVPSWNDWVFETPERHLVLQVKGELRSEQRGCRVQRGAGENEMSQYAIAVVVGSLRRDSLNRKLATAIEKLVLRILPSSRRGSTTCRSTTRTTTRTLPLR